MALACFQADPSLHAMGRWLVNRYSDQANRRHHVPVGIRFRDRDQDPCTRWPPMTRFAARGSTSGDISMVPKHGLLSAALWVFALTAARSAGPRRNGDIRQSRVSVGYRLWCPTI